MTWTPPLPAATTPTSGITVTTESGMWVDLLNTAPEMIRLRDIAAHLAKIVRWYGSTTAPYSVAQHSCLVAAHLEQRLGPLAGLYGLHHDAHEAYWGDLPTPQRTAITALVGHDVWHLVTARMDRAIFAALRLPWPMPAEIEAALKKADEAAAAAEWRDLRSGDHWPPRAFHAPPLLRAIRIWSWHQAEERYLAAHERLCVAAGIKSHLQEARSAVGATGKPKER